LREEIEQFRLGVYRRVGSLILTYLGNDDLGFFLPLVTCMWINPGARSYMVLVFTNGFLQELTLFSWSCGVLSALPVIQAMS
jgi:hypothetical protein